MKRMLYENLGLWVPQADECAGEFMIPSIEPYEGEIPDAWLPFNYAKSRPVERVALQMFLDDYQLARLWNSPQQYVALLSRASAVCSPDFSLYTDAPEILNIYNHYKKHWLGAWWQMMGVNVIPTICWAGPDSYKYCFDGEPSGAVVAVSSVGTQKSAKKEFLHGYDAMLERLSPSVVLFWGNVPQEARGNIKKIDSFIDEARKRVDHAQNKP